MERSRLRQAVLAALTEEPYIYIVEDEAEKEVDGIISDMGLWGLVVKVKLNRNGGGRITAYLVDLSKIERLCAYELCSKVEDPVQRDACIARCASSKVQSIILERIGG